MSFNSIKGRKLRVKVINAADAASLETAVQAWLDGLDEEILVGLPVFAEATGDYTIVYHYMGG